MEYIIQLENFEGPFDLLLELIKKRQMDINDLQISQITQDYLETLKVLEEQDIELTSGFTEMASVLLGIKVKMLLPKEKENDPRANLIEQLINYQEYKESVFKMKELKYIEQTLVKRQKEDRIVVEKKGTKEELQRIFSKIMRSMTVVSSDDSKLDQLTEIIKSSKFSSAEKMLEIKEQFTDSDYSISVEVFFSSLSCKEEVVVSFGVLLELIKLQEVMLFFQGDVLCLKKHDVNEIEDIEEELV